MSAPPFVVRQFEGTPWVPLHEAARLHDAHQRAELRVIAAQNEAAALRDHIRRYGALPVRGYDQRLLEAAHEVLPEFMEGATVEVGVERWARLRALVNDALPDDDR